MIDGGIVAYPVAASALAEFCRFLLLSNCVQSKSGTIPTFDELDTNQDGVVDRAEFTAGLYGVYGDRIRKHLLARHIEEFIPTLPVIVASLAPLDRFASGESS